MSDHSYIACDLGAGSGRVMLGRIANGKLTLDEVHRFVSPPVNLRGTLRWNIIQIFEELKAGLRKIAAAGGSPTSVSVDSWGVDYVLLNARQPMLSLPYNYRDARTDATYAAALKSPGPELIFGETGIQFMPLNTLYQMIAEVKQNADAVGIADQFLNIADYFNFLFCGVGKVEESMASTTQMYDPRTRQWSRKLIKTFGFPERIFPPIVPSGTRLGTLLPQLREETGLANIDVIATCSHDTGAAVAAVPAEGDDWAYLSSGTWSLIGVELPAPLINDEVRTQNFTNEGGYGGTTRFLKNIAGMWILQECRRTWQRQGQQFDYDELTRLASEAEPFRSLINPNAARFAKPDDMQGKIAAFCLESGQPAPETPGQFVRCILESLTLLYARTLGELQRLTGRAIRTLHIVGGGSKNALLNQFTASATGRAVLAGPVEATALGNVLIQAITLGHIASLQRGREIVRASFPIQEFQPRQTAEWQRTAENFAKIDPEL
jgi:rhamnulokinase